MVGKKRTSSAQSATVAGVTTALAAIVIGCGGGGGGAVASSTGNADLGNSTSGSTLTGSTTSTTAGKSTSGGTSTSGSSTSGSSTSATAGSSSAGSTSGSVGAGSNVPSGVLASNTIFFSDNVYTALTLKDVAPDGSALTTIGSVPSGMGAAVVNPNVPAGVLFSYSPNGGEYGLYKNSSLSSSGATQLVSAVFDSVSMIQLTPDNQTVVLVATQNGKSGLYTVPAAGGNPKYLALADSASLSPDGTVIVFSQATASGEAIMMIPTAGGSTTSLTDGTTFDVDPQFSKDGTMVVFSSDRTPSGSGGSIGIVSLKLSDQSLTYITSDPSSAEFGPSFSASGTQVSYVVENGNPGASGLYVCNVDGSNAQQIYASDSIGQSSYWTGANGRGVGRSFPLFQRIRRRK